MSKTISQNRNFSRTEDFLQSELEKLTAIIDEITENNLYIVRIDREDNILYPFLQKLSFSDLRRILIKKFGREQTTRFFSDSYVDNSFNLGALTESVIRQSHKNSTILITPRMNEKIASAYKIIHYYQEMLRQIHSFNANQLIKGLGYLEGEIFNVDNCNRNRLNEKELEKTYHRLSKFPISIFRKIIQNSYHGKNDLLRFARMLTNLGEEEKALILNNFKDFFSERPDFVDDLIILIVESAAEERSSSDDIQFNILLEMAELDDDKKIGATFFNFLIEKEEYDIAFMVFANNPEVILKSDKNDLWPFDKILKSGNVDLLSKMVLSEDFANLVKNFFLSKIDVRKEFDRKLIDFLRLNISLPKDLDLLFSDDFLQTQQIKLSDLSDEVTNQLNLYQELIFSPELYFEDLILKESDGFYNFLTENNEIFIKETLSMVDLSKFENWQLEKVKDNIKVLKDHITKISNENDPHKSEYIATLENILRSWIEETQKIEKEQKHKIIDNLFVANTDNFHQFLQENSCFYVREVLSEVAISTFDFLNNEKIKDNIEHLENYLSEKRSENNEEDIENIRILSYVLKKWNEKIDHIEKTKSQKVDRRNLSKYLQKKSEFKLMSPLSRSSSKANIFDSTSEKSQSDVAKKYQQESPLLQALKQNQEQDLAKKSDHTESKNLVQEINREFKKALSDLETRTEKSSSSSTIQPEIVETKEFALKEKPRSSLTAKTASPRQQFKERELT